MADNGAGAGIRWDKEVDWLVVGGGGAGMVSALTAKHLGLDTLVIEKAPYMGGSTARSGGVVWIPNNYLVREGGLPDSEERARTYMASTVGNRVPSEVQESFVKYGPQMIEFLRDHTETRFVWSKGYSDYYPEATGGFPEGRALEAVPFNGTLLGDNQKYFRPPVLSGTHYAGLLLFELFSVARMRRHWDGKLKFMKAAYNTITNRLLGKKVMTAGQGTAGRLFYSILRANIPFEVNTALTSLVTENGRVVGAEVSKGGRTLRYKARRGVALTAGGFAHNQEMRDRYLPHPTSSKWSLAAESDTGDAIRAGESIGARLDLMDDAWWGPVSHVNANENPHFCVLERSLPGSMIVNSSGDRFVNEAAPYCDVVTRIYEVHNGTGTSCVPVWLILDKAYKDYYMIASNMPRQPIPKRWNESGDVVSASSLAELAEKIGVPADRLAKSMERFNKLAETGVDEDYHRGDSAHDRMYGDPYFKNPNLAPLTKAPFFAIRLYPGDIGTRGGLVINRFGQVVSQSGEVIEGLWAAGNSTASVMGNSYPGPGATIGPAMTFGYISAMKGAGLI